MRIAAILSIGEESSGPAGVAPELATPGLFRNESSARVEILGQSLLDRTLQKLKQFGVCDYAIVQNSHLPSESTASAVAAYVNGGIDLLVWQRLDAYCDIDYNEFLQFHLQSDEPITHACAEDGDLGLAIASAAQFAGSSEEFATALRTAVPYHSPFDYRGYVNRLTCPQDFHQLMEDGLLGKCELRPVGNQTRPAVWEGAEAEIDETSVIAGPAFIGAGCRIAAGCRLTGNTSIERGCEVDCGTTVESSWVRENTYLGVALDVRRAIVSRNTLFHLERNVSVTIADRRLVGGMERSSSLLAGLSSFFRSGEARTSEIHNV